ncbi:MAG: hypothetical protein LIO41_05200 [Ruminococcus sp.]|nr:hypothetical protein [Ruminococcus sp.]
MEYVLSIIGEIVLTGTIAVLSYSYKRIAKKLAEQEKVKDGVVAILQDRILCIGMKLIAKGEVSLSELRNFENLYSVYHSLGGNSTGTEIFNRVKSMDILTNAN